MWWVSEAPMALLVCTQQGWFLCCCVSFTHMLHGVQSDGRVALPTELSEEWESSTFTNSRESHQVKIPVSMGAILESWS